MSRKQRAVVALVAVAVLVGSLAPIAAVAREPEPGDHYFSAYPVPRVRTPAWDTYGRVLLDVGSRVLLQAAPAAVRQLARQGVHVQALQAHPGPVRAAAPTQAVASIVAPDPRVQAMIDEVTTGEIYQNTGDLSGEWPVQIGGQPYTIATRYTYSGTPIQKATQYVGERFASLGLDVEYHIWRADRPPNVIGELPGVSGSDEILMITGHLDSITYKTPMTLAPGADDNASGAVAVLMAAKILSEYPWRCTLRFATWTGEEQGLLGSQAYAQRSHDAGENIQGVLNLDMIAWNTPGSARTIDLHANEDRVPASLALAQLFAEVVDVYDIDLIPTIIPNGIGASDHAPFWQYGYSAILGIEDYGTDFNPYYHSNDDLLANLDMSYYTDFVKASVATFAHMGCLAEGAIAGHVTDAALGIPLAASVRMTGTLGLTYEMETGVGGYYTQTVLPDTYTMVVSAPGYRPATVAGVVVGQGTTAQDFALDQEGPGYGAIAGYVTGANSGAPVIAIVSLSSTPGLTYTTSSDASGYYSHLVVSGTYTVTGTAPAYTPTTVSGVVVTSTLVTQDLALQPFHRVQVDLDVLVATLNPGEQVSYTVRITNPAATGANWGAYELPVAVRGDVAWLDLAPASGTLAAGEVTSLTVTFDAEGLEWGLYTATLVFAVDRPGWAEVRVPAILAVGLERLYYLPAVMRRE